MHGCVVRFWPILGRVPEFEGFMSLLTIGFEEGPSLGNAARTEVMMMRGFVFARGLDATSTKQTEFKLTRGTLKAASRVAAIGIVGLGLAACASDEPEFQPLPAPQAAPASSGQPRVAAKVVSPNAGQQTARPSGVTSAPPTMALTPGGQLPGFVYTNSTVAPRVKEIRGEYDALVAAIAGHAQQLENVRMQTSAAARQYHGTYAAIEARLQLGTTPGNPILVRQWNEAQAALTSYAQGLGVLNGLSTAVAGDNASTYYLKNKIAATLNLVGALDEDHRQLYLMDDALDRVTLKLEKLLAEVTDEQARETNYVANQQANLTTLSLAIKNGELYGSSLANRAYSTTNVPGTSPSGQFPAADPNAKPLIVIRFNEDNPDYQQALYTALAAALQRRPDAHFDLVAVSPVMNAPAQNELVKTETRRHASSVLRAVTDMGLPPSRVRISSASSQKAAESQVHIYVR